MRKGKKILSDCAQKNSLGGRDTVPSANTQHSDPKETLPRAFTLA